MNIDIRAYDQKDIAEAIYIWNEVVQDGIAFPQMDLLTESSGDRFFSEQSFTGIAHDQDRKEIVGLYILHPNNVGRCGHISNASYAVKKGLRGHGIGEKLVIHSMSKAKELGFKILQFNAVVKSNKHALQLYEKLGFVKLGTIPNGFLMKDGHLF
jgi:GNAT superfamily N-acetyltransferase